RIVSAQRHQIAAADLALDGEAELFEEAFDGKIKRGFQGLLRLVRARLNLPTLAEFRQSVCSGNASAAIIGAGTRPTALRETRDRSFAGHWCLPSFGVSRACCKGCTNSVSRRRAGKVPA